MCGCKGTIPAETTGCACEKRKKARIMTIVATVILFIVGFMSFREWRKTGNNVFLGAFITAVALKVMTIGFAVWSWWENREDKDDDPSVKTSDKAK